MDPSCCLAMQFGCNYVKMRLNGAFKTEGKYRHIQEESMRKIKFFFNITACKHVLVETQNTSTNLKMSLIWTF